MLTGTNLIAGTNSTLLLRDRRSDRQNPDTTYRGVDGGIRVAYIEGNHPIYPLLFTRTGRP